MPREDSTHKIDCLLIKIFVLEKIILSRSWVGGNFKLPYFLQWRQAKSSTENIYVWKFFNISPFAYVLVFTARICVSLLRMKLDCAKVFDVTVFRKCFCTHSSWLSWDWIRAIKTVSPATCVCSTISLLPANARAIQRQKKTDGKKEKE